MPELIREEINKDTVIAIWRITETWEELEAMISLRPEEKALYGSFVAEDRKRQWLAYRILIRSILAPDDFPVEYDSTGKPYLAGCEWNISVTHSYEMAGVIISRTARVGIDIEKIRSRIEKVTERFLSHRELQIFARPGDHYAMTLAWSAKEALYKLYGMRTLDFRENIILSGLPAGPAGEFKGEITLDGNSKGYLIKSRVFDGYILVYVHDEPF